MPKTLSGDPAERSPKTIARIAGPTMVTVAVTERINLHIFAISAAPVVYLNGTLLFVAGIAMVQAYSRWQLRWSVLVTLSGWIAAALGLFRMLAPEARQLGRGVAADLVLAAIGLCGGILCVKGYLQSRTGKA